MDLYEEADGLRWGELSDDELRLTVFAAAERRDALSEAGNEGSAEYFNALACSAAAERDRRRELYKETAAAVIGIVAMEARILRSPSERRADRREQRRRG
ncbi:hypothetical protein [Streptomyces chiangmaiensis]|uniref:Uncharacterized protein n=1 Tax=Streptomyces chiangmaiensis TaxID=766497 RepID=A0ABU7FS41_9ACTN|nr:hypothetical protein [Streptomyces chiangmaiensis]MED7826804.1 hypothetical protein [Streptomyces chiangmaiensis]